MNSGGQMVFLHLLCWIAAALFRVTLANDRGHFINVWAAEIPGGLEMASDVAEKHGYRLVRELHSFPDHYLLEREDVPGISRRSSDHHTRRLINDDQVLYAEQQQHRPRAKRELFDRRTAREVVASNGQLDDPEFSYEWYINQSPSLTRRRGVIVTDLRVKDVWKKGLTGKNVVIAVVDDGLEKDHPDIFANYDPLASYDFNDNDNDPYPRYEPTNENKHGTRCAGVIAMMANNNICGVGIAFDSKIGGIRALDGRITDHVEANSIGFNHKHIDIYSASWGPNDDGKQCEMPGRLVQKVMKRGITEGRGGRGVLFVWASGNGGHFGDNCNTDGYVSAIETISISSASQNGKIPFYAEKCSSTLATAYSSGSYSEKSVVSADLHHKCTEHHTGTSAASPMVVGILALLLEANPNVTWRDVQHIIVQTSRMEPLASAKGWYRNGVGYCVNLAFGFGLVDALAITDLGDPATWKNVGRQRQCIIKPSRSSNFPYEFVSGQWVEIGFESDGCAGQDGEINYLEHIKVYFNVSHGRRGRVYAEVQSPMGTVTPLMLERFNDNSTQGFKNWPLISTHNWGENPRGLWKFRVADRNHGNFTGKFKNATLVLYGTKEQPEYQKYGQRNCRNLSLETNQVKKSI